MPREVVKLLRWCANVLATLIPPVILVDAVQYFVDIVRAGGMLLEKSQQILTIHVAQNIICKAFAERHDFGISHASVCHTYEMLNLGVTASP